MALHLPAHERPTAPPRSGLPQQGPPSGGPSIATPESSPSGSRRSRRRKVARIAVGVGGAFVVTAGAVGYWAANEYLIDHVEVSDVAAFEADQAADSVTGDAATSQPDATASETATSEIATASEAIAAGAVVTEDSYVSDTTSITISTHVVGSGSSQVTYYVADVEVTDAALLRAGFANNQFGENIVADTSDIAAQYDAIFAINGDYYGFRDTGIVIRNGVLYRDDPARTGLAIYADGTMEVYDETETSGEELLAAGVWQTLSFGPALLDDGEIVDGIDDVEVDTNFGNHSIQGNQPRTGIGVIDANHFVFVVVDGRSAGYSVGVTMTEFAQIFADLGATEAYNLDGGGSSTMVFDGELVNDPLGKGNERETSDILYIAS